MLFGLKLFLHKFRAVVMSKLDKWVESEIPGIPGEAFLFSIYY